MNVTALSSLQQAVAEMDMRIRVAFKDWGNAPEHVQMRGVRIEVNIAVAEPMQWLLAQRKSRQVFWCSRDQKAIVAGVGFACELATGTVEEPEAVFRRGREILASFGSAKPRFFGGFSFSKHAVDEDPWPGMGTSRFWIPRAEVLIRGDKSYLACNILFQRNVQQSLEDVLAEWANVAAQYRSVADLPTLMCRRDHPDREGWESNVRSALGLIENGVLDKLVLARKAVYTFAVPVTAAQVLSVLQRVTSNCYTFLIQPSHEVALMSTTPECLYRREGSQINTEALAGTRPRVSNEEEDSVLGKELMENPKERHEQELVRKDLIRQLHLLCDTVEADPEPSLLKLERKQHLISRLSGRLRSGVTDADILKALHPTPAVGGSPRANALRELPRLEPFSRGWYAGPVGCFSEEEAEFAVAIRSGLVHGRDVNVYSGAGIVEGSDPAREWQEIENKISDFVKVTRGQIR
jgi:menaquinone-specific isochorismate synthase